MTTRLRDLVLLLARLDSDDPAVRRTAEAELSALRREIGDGPSPGERFGKRVAQILRDQADRLSPDQSDPGSTAEQPTRGNGG